MEIQTLYQRFLECGKVSTDTRQILPDSIFFALKGPKFNANEFAEEALNKGARYAVVDEEKFVKDERFLLVKDGLLALQDLARHHRDQLTIPIIGLTGSNGKTTSKELVHAVLSKKFKTFATKGNLNNHIGVPLSLLSIDKSIEMAVIEMGANHVGEIAQLSDIAKPTHGFITNIGKAHIGTFGGFDNIVRGKSELYHHLITHKGTVFINSLNPILSNMAKRFAKPFFYPQQSDYYHCELIGADPLVNVRAENGEEVQSNLAGAYNFENIATALCIAKFFGVDGSEANKAIAEYKPGNMRSQIVVKGGNLIVLDAYNANPSSMQAAIENLSSMKADRKVAILGDMFELEEEAEREHTGIGKLLAEKKFDEVYLCGSLMRAAASQLPNVFYFEHKDDLIKRLKNNPITGATILIKASRGIGLETVMDYL